MFGIDDAVLGIGAGVALLGGALGKLFSGADKETQRKLLQQATDAYGNIDLPKLKEITATQLGGTALSGVRTDPRLRQAQMDELDQLQELARTGGLSLSDKAGLADVEDQTSRQASAGRARIQQEMDARGTGDSGTNLLLQMGANRDATQRSAEAGRHAAATAQQREWDAMMGAGRVAGEMRTQDYGEKSREAEARDAIAKYNAAARERSTYHNASLPQQQFGNAMQKANGQAGGYRAQADLYGDNAKETQNTWTQMGQAGANVAKGVYESDEREKDRKAWGY